ncbi:MAG TPA: hypothetical protein VK306_11555 [Acidimicrobiales bacterium]|nr:hypothetical protein [Acidimicrobiales bacterium]
MFIQVIRGQVADAEGLEAALDRWQEEVRPGAVGFLGSTGGVTPDGRAVVLARFESAEAAKANSDRPEQGAWWAEAERCFSGPITFHDCTEVDTYRAGGADDAGFVQVMTGRADRQRMRRMDELAEPLLPDLRPDLLGSVRAWDGDEYTEAAYFTSEVEARAGEAQEPPAELADAMREWEDVMGDVTYYDLPAPRLVS